MLMSYPLKAFMPLALVAWPDMAPPQGATRSVCGIDGVGMALRPHR